MNRDRPWTSQGSDRQCVGFAEERTDLSNLGLVRIAVGLPTRGPPGCVMSAVRERARVIDEGYGPGFHYLRRPSPPGV